MNKKFAQELKYPSSKFRGKPFWAWNGKLEEMELRRQIRIMKAMGFGGFFMHSRVGLDTPYLSEEWFRCIDSCVDEAEKHGMEAWLYDEDRWPSGAAGGIVTRNKKYRMRRLEMFEFEKSDQFKWSKDTVAAFHVKINVDNVRVVKRLHRSEKVPALNTSEKVLAFVSTIEKEKEWFNGATYLDTLNPEAVREFIKVTHEQYKKRYGKKFGRSIPGIFTDEPHHGSMMEKVATDEPFYRHKKQETVMLVWTDALLQTFRKRYGYDLSDHLVELVYDIEGSYSLRARYHYHDCTTYMFVNSFARQIGEWCDKNGISFTGHVLMEDKPSSQTKVVGSAMRFYEYMQLPGIDLLTERWRIYDTAKQCSSVARQFGARWRLTETYGCTGWDFSFAGHKALGDWQAALGINVRCHHLSWYTMRGEAKRDYPAGIFYQSPWWEYYSKVEDYFSRINVVMTEGEEIRDLLVIHPVESAWLACKKGWESKPDTSDIDKSLVTLRDTLLAGHIDFDYGEEEIMSRHSRIVRNKHGVHLSVNKAAYKVVVIPYMKTIRKSTLEILIKFADAGGKVVFAGIPPTRIDGIISDEISSLFKKATAASLSGDDLLKAVKPARRISIIDKYGNEAESVLYLLKECKDHYSLFVCNTSITKEQMYADTMKGDLVVDRKVSYESLTISGFAGCNGMPIQIDAETGNLYSANAIKNGDVWNIKCNMPVIGSALFVIPKKEMRTSYNKISSYVEIKREKMEREKWNISLSEPNILVLDRPNYTINRKKYVCEEILRIDDKIRDFLGIKRRGGGMIQPWAERKDKSHKSVPVTLTYSFMANHIPDGELFIAIESPEKFVIRINGTRLNTDMKSGWWADSSLEKVPLNHSLIKPGLNTLEMCIDYCDNFAGLEIIYLLGNFGASISDTEVAITNLVTELQIGDWTRQGLPFYAGSVSYYTDFEVEEKKNIKLFVSLPEYRGIAFRIFVNSIYAGMAAWAPDEVDITELVKTGGNTLQIEIIGHRRNSHGPHHYSEKWPTWTGPAQYRSRNEWFDGYNLVPCGLLKSPEIITRKAEQLLLF